MKRNGMILRMFLALALLIMMTPFTALADEEAGNIQAGKQNRPAPTLTWENTTYEDWKNGVIYGVDDTMEWQVAGSGSWSNFYRGATAMFGLAAGTYEVRYIETQQFYASDPTTVIIESGPQPLEALTLTPSPIDFGVRIDGSTDSILAQTVTVTNTGTTYLLVDPQPKWDNDSFIVSKLSGPSQVLPDGEVLDNSNLSGPPGEAPDSIYLIPGSQTTFTVQPKVGLPCGTYTTTIELFSRGDFYVALEDGKWIGEGTGSWDGSGTPELKHIATVTATYKVDANPEKNVASGTQNSTLAPTGDSLSPHQVGIALAVSASALVLAGIMMTVRRRNAQK